VIVYICDSRGVRDILDTDGSSALATSEPLAVLVIFLFCFLLSLHWCHISRWAQMHNTITMILDYICFHH